MSDEIRPDNVVTMDEAKLAKAWGIKPGAIRIVELSGDDGLWKTTPLAVPAALTYAAGQLGLEMPTDWPSRLEPGDPMFEAWQACGALGTALKGLRAAAERYRDDWTRRGAHESAKTLDVWATQLDALMRAMHLQANQAYKIAKAEEGKEAERRLREEGLIP